MTLTCLKCGKELTVRYTGKPGVGECPNCKKKINFPESSVEYKIVTQQMLAGDKGFDKNGNYAEGYLNALALEGWRVVGCTTQAARDWGFAGFFPSAVLILERPVKQ